MGERFVQIYVYNDPHVNSREITEKKKKKKSLFSTRKENEIEPNQKTILITNFQSLIPRILHPAVIATTQFNQN